MLEMLSHLYTYSEMTEKFNNMDPKKCEVVLLNLFCFK